MRRLEGATEILLAKLAEVKDDEARGYVTLALGMIGAGEALETIHELVRRSKYRPELLRQAAISLGLLGDKNVVPELTLMLERASSLSAQASIAHGLGAIGDARSIGPLIDMLGDSDVTPRAPRLRRGGPRHRLRQGGPALDRQALDRRQLPREHDDADRRPRRGHPRDPLTEARPAPRP